MSDLLDDHFEKYKEPIVPSDLAKFKGKIPYLILDAYSIGELCPLFEEAELDYALQRQERMISGGVNHTELHTGKLDELEVLVYIKEEEKEQADQLVAAYEKKRAEAEALFQEKLPLSTPLSKFKEALIWIVVVVLSMLFVWMMLRSL